MKSLHTCPMEIPKYIHFSSDGDDIDEVRIKMMKSLIDPKNFDIFLESPFGKYLLEGIQDESKVEAKGITKVSQFIRAQNSYSKAQRRAKFEATMQVNRLKDTSSKPKSASLQRKASRNQSSENVMMKTTPP